MLAARAGRCTPCRAREREREVYYQLVPSDLVAEFRARGVLYDATEGLAELSARERLTAYAGFDPTASSLHVGSLLPLMALRRLQRLGHTPIAIVGGGTGLVGDPSGKSQERVLLTRQRLDENVAGIRSQIERFLAPPGEPSPALIIDNATWLSAIDLMTFLRDTGKHFTVNYLLQKEAVSRRLESEDGISFTEFSYLLLQAYDFLQLFDRHGCTLQIGGSDQWGNITAGIDLIRKLRAKKAHGLVMPLVTTVSGVKFGKTEAGAVWLDPARTSPYEFYQFWLNTDDRDAIKYLRFFTFLDEPAIGAIETEMRRAPESRVAQRTLAREVTALVHGRPEVARAERSAAAMFGGDVRTLGAAEFLMAFDSVPSTSVTPESVSAGLAVTDLLVASGLAKSKSEATRLVRGGGVYLNGERVGDERRQIGSGDVLHGRFLVLRKGAKQQHVVKVESHGS
jgi:tyrosyl-tRNA synthetase